MLGAALGVLFIGVVNGALPVIQVSPFWQQAIAGAVILISVTVNARAERRAGRQILERTRELWHESLEHMGAGAAGPVGRAAGGALASRSRAFMTPDALADSTFNFSEKGILALALALAHHHR